jgi:hypothetical protein
MSRNDYSIVTPPYTAESINSASLLTESVSVSISEINQIQSQPRSVTSNAEIIDSLSNDGSITLNELILKLPYNNRPTQEQRTLIMHELQEIGLIETSSAAKKSILIRKGPLYY